MRIALAGLFLSLAACAPATPPPAAPSSPVAPPAASAPPPSSPDSLCPALCALHPTAASPEAPMLKGQPPGVVRVLLLWKEPNGDAIQAVGGLNDLAERLKGLPGVELVLVSVDDDGARAAQARRELIDKDTPVRLVFGDEAQQVAATLAPDRLPATYVLDRQQRPALRFDGVPAWRSAATRTLFEGLAAEQRCSYVIENEKNLGPTGCPAR